MKIDPKAEPKEASIAEKSALNTANSVEILTAKRPNEIQELTDDETLIDDPSAQGLTLNKVSKQLIELHVPTE